MIDYRIILRKRLIMNQNSETIIARGKCGDSAWWTLNEDGIFTIKGTGVVYDYLITDLPWYQYRHQINSIIIKEGITGLGKFNFYDNYAKSVVLPNSLINIPSYCFEYSRITEVSIPLNAYVESNAFQSCGALEKVVLNCLSLPNTGAFSSCSNLTNVEIVNTIFSPTGNPFVYCENLSSIITNDNFIVEGNALYDKDKRCLITYFNKSLESGCVLPYSIREITSYAFVNGTNIHTITLNDNLEEINEWAFIGTAITNITIPQSVWRIEPTALYAESLSSISVNSANTEFKANNGVLYSYDMTYIKFYPPAKTGTSFTISASAYAIETYAFMYSNYLTNLKIPSAISYIKENSISYWNKLTRISYGGSQSAWRNAVGDRTIGIESAIESGDVTLLFNQSV